MRSAELPPSPLAEQLADALLARLGALVADQRLSVHVSITPYDELLPEADTDAP